MTFNEFILTNKVTIRLSFFFGVFAVMAIWEVIAPRRALTVSKTIRWVNNLGLVFFNSFIIRILFPVAAVGVAAFVETHGWGLLNYYELPGLLAIAIAIAVVAMDFIVVIFVPMVPSLVCLIMLVFTVLKWTRKSVMIASVVSRFVI